MKKEENRYCLYCHTNKENGKKYFGITCNTKNRFGKNGYGYLHKNEDGTYVQPLFARAILKYGWENFSHDILFDNLTLEQAKELEIEYISKYNTNNAKYGYNNTKGGDAFPMTARSEEAKRKLKESHTIYNINQYSLDGEYIKTWYNCYDIERELGILSSNIYNSINRESGENGVGYCKGYLWKKIPNNEEIDNSDVYYIPKTNKKNIYCMDLQCNIIKEYDSIKSASEDLGIDSSLIVPVCKQKRKSTYNYRFCYVEDYDNIKNIEYINNHCRKVLLLDKHNNILKEYDMITDLARDMNVKSPVIRKKILSGTLYRKKYKICFKEDYENILANSV